MGFTMAATVRATDTVAANPGSTSVTSRSTTTTMMIMIMTMTTTTMKIRAMARVVIGDMERDATTLGTSTMDMTISGHVSIPGITEGMDTADLAEVMEATADLVVDLAEVTEATADLV